MAARVTESAPEQEGTEQETEEVTESAPEQEGYTKLKSPSGAVTTVPNSIKDVLVEGGYKSVRK